VQIELLARGLGWLTLEMLAYDGTRLKANNHLLRARVRMGGEGGVPCDHLSHSTQSTSRKAREFKDQDVV